MEQVVSTEVPIDPQNNPGKDIVEGWAAAQQARNELFARNENMAQEVARMENEGLSPQEIISSLEPANAQDVQDRQSLIDYYNTQARYNSYMNEAAKKIDEEAKRKREQSTFHGTINDDPTSKNLIYISF